MREAADFVATEGGRLRTGRLVDLELLRILQNRYAHADESFARYYSLVAHGGVYAKKAKRLDGATAGDDDM